MVEDDEEDESEGKYKEIRYHVEKFFKQSLRVGPFFGNNKNSAAKEGSRNSNWIDLIMAILSFLSSVTFVALTYQDLSQFDPCCSQGLPNCMPACTEFYNIRVPRSFIYADKIYCGIYLVDYLINLFISQNRR